MAALDHLGLDELLTTSLQHDPGGLLPLEYEMHEEAGKE